MKQPEALSSNNFIREEVFHLFNNGYIRTFYFKCIECGREFAKTQSQLARAGFIRVCGVKCNGKVQIRNMNKIKQSSTTKNK